MRVHTNPRPHDPRRGTVQPMSQEDMAVLDELRKRGAFRRYFERGRV